LSYFWEHSSSILTPHRLPLEPPQSSSIFFTCGTSFALLEAGGDVMATNFENAGQRTIEEQEQRNNIVVEFKSLLREIDDFVCKLKALEATLAQRAEENEEENILSSILTGFDAAVLKRSDDPLETVKRKGL
jgi:hypothetical protein